MVSENCGEPSGTVHHMTRHCDRPDCAEPAIATFAYGYSERTVWLIDLNDEPHPFTYDLCGRHAEALSVPRGWELKDRREVVLPFVREAS